MIQKSINDLNNTRRILLELCFEVNDFVDRFKFDILRGLHIVKSYKTTGCLRQIILKFLLSEWQKL